MTYAPYAVGSFLYSGISEAIVSVTKAAKNKYWSSFYATQVIRIKEAIDWYSEHCVAGVTYLIEEYEKMLELVSDKFIYDATHYYRYSLTRKLMDGVEREERNCLIEKSKIGKDLHVGLVFKTNDGDYAKIVIIVNHTEREEENMYGSFNAEQLTYEEIIQMRKGG